MWPARTSERTCEAGIPNRRLRSFEANSCSSSTSGLSGGRLPGGALRFLALLQARGGFRSAGIDTGAQCLHQVDDVAADGRNRCLGQGDLLALHLLLNGRFDASLELVVIFVRVESLHGQMLDELLGELQLGI